MERSPTFRLFVGSSQVTVYVPGVAVRLGERPVQPLMEFPLSCQVDRVGRIERTGVGRHKGDGIGDVLTEGEGLAEAAMATETGSGSPEAVDDQARVPKETAEPAMNTVRTFFNRVFGCAGTWQPVSGVDVNRPVCEPQCRHNCCSVYGRRHESRRRRAVEVGHERWEKALRRQSGLARSHAKRPTRRTIQRNPALPNTVCWLASVQDLQLV